MNSIYQGKPKTDIQRMMNHYGVSEINAIQTRGTGLKRSGLFGIIDRRQAATEYLGEPAAQTPTTQPQIDTPMSASAGLTMIEDLIKKGLSPDDAAITVGVSLVDTINGIPRYLLNECAVNRVRNKLIGLDEAYEICAQEYASARNRLVVPFQETVETISTKKTDNRFWLIGLGGLALLLS